MVKSEMNMKIYYSSGFSVVLGKLPEIIIAIIGTTLKKKVFIL